MSWTYKYSKEYTNLTSRFPLVPIRSRKQHSAAIESIKPFFLNNRLTIAEADYFDVLTQLIKNYEDKIIKPVSLSPQSALDYLMELHDLTQSDIALLASTQRSHISEFFSGKRSLSKDAAARLGARFKVDPMLFLPKVLPFADKSSSAQLTSPQKRNRQV
jgi:HTH-type transcriptional regulator/antitoxin HigA